MSDKPKFATLQPGPDEVLPLLVRLWLQSRPPPPPPLPTLPNAKVDDKETKDGQKNDAEKKGDDSTSKTSAPVADEKATAEPKVVEATAVIKGGEPNGAAESHLEPKLPGTAGKDTTESVHDEQPTASGSKKAFDTSCYAEAGTQRQLTKANLLISMDILRLIAPRVRRYLRREHFVRLAVYFVGQVVLGLAPSFTLWARTLLLDRIGERLKGRAVTRGQILVALFMTIVVFPARATLNLVLEKNTQKLHEDLENQIEAGYLHAQLSLTIRDMNNDLEKDLLHEAGILAGFNRIMRISAHGWPSLGGGRTLQPRVAMSTIGKVIRDVIDVTSQLVLVVSRFRRSGNAFSLENALIASLSLYPFVFRRLERAVNRSRSQKIRMQAQDEPPRYTHLDKTAVRDFTKPEMKQELVLFGLKDWVMERWYKIQNAPPSPIQMDTGHHQIQIGFDTARQTAAILVDAFLANRALTSGGELSLGSMQVYQTLFTKTIPLVPRLVGDIHRIGQLPFVVAAYISMLNGPPRTGPQLDYEAYRLSGGMLIEARHLSFAYPDKPLVLHDINLKLEPGDTLAIVGFNGGGKTTLAKVLMGLHGHDGELLLNGRPLDDYNADTLHARMSAIFQDFQKYELSLRNNVGLGDTRSLGDEAAIQRAISRGGAEGVAEQVGSLNKRLRPHLYDPGSRFHTSQKEKRVDPTSLSGGQWQRVALARAFMRADSADLVVFDEPTASLDAVAESELFERIHGLSKRKDGTRSATTIFISHRFNTVRQADKIAFLDKGRIVEYGTHRELMALGGEYHRMFTLQRKGYVDDDDEDEASTSASTSAKPSAPNGTPVRDSSANGAFGASSANGTPPQQNGSTGETSGAANDVTANQADTKVGNGTTTVEGNGVASTGAGGGTEPPSTTS